MFPRVPTRYSITFRLVVRRCLQKDPKQRLHDVADLRLAMEGAFETTFSAPIQPAIEPTPQVWQRPVPAAMALLVAVLVTGAGVLAMMRPDVIPTGLVRFTIVPPETAPLDLARFDQELAISPDGTQVVYQSQVSGGGVQLYLRPLDQLVGAPLPGGENGTGPFFSPDGEWVGFIDSNNRTQVSTLGGPPVTLTESPNNIQGAHWGTDDQIIYGTLYSGLFRVSADGGQPEALTRYQGGFGHNWPFIIPDHEAVLFTTSEDAPMFGGQLAALDLKSGEVTRLNLAGFSPRYVSTGHLVYATSDGSVRAVSFDATSLQVIGNPVSVVEDVAVKSSGAAYFGISDNGRLVYVVGEISGRTRDLIWVDRLGQEERLADWQAAQYLYPRFSPDGTRLAVAIAENADSNNNPSDLWVLDLARGSRSRITFGGNPRFFVWSPDGSQLVFADFFRRPNRLLSAPADGSGQIETVLDRGEVQIPTSWTPEANTLAFDIVQPEQGAERGIGTKDIWVLPMDGDRTPEAWLTTPFRDQAGAFSPDGHWLAYVSDKSGQDEVYVRPYPGPGQERTISTNGGQAPVWSPDGRELFFRHENEVLVVAVDTLDLFSPPERLFAGDYDIDPSGSGRPNFDVAPDGQGFVMVKKHGSAEEAAAEITVVLNWIEELKERVPVD